MEDNWYELNKTQFEKLYSKKLEKQIFDYYSSIDTMINITPKKGLENKNNEEIEKDKKLIDQYKNFIDSHVAKSIISSTSDSSDLFRLLINPKSNFNNNSKLKMYVFSNENNGT